MALPESCNFLESCFSTMNVQIMCLFHFPPFFQDNYITFSDLLKPPRQPHSTLSFELTSYLTEKSEAFIKECFLSPLHQIGKLATSKSSFSCGECPVSSKAVMGAFFIFCKIQPLSLLHYRFLLMFANHSHLHKNSLQYPSSNTPLDCS